MTALQLPEIARTPAHHLPGELCTDECCISAGELQELVERIRERVSEALQCLARPH